MLIKKYKRCWGPCPSICVYLLPYLMNQTNNKKGARKMKLVVTFSCSEPKFLQLCVLSVCEINLMSACFSV